jgi:hypothetical protein
MTNETIKVLLMLSLFGALEIALHQPRMLFARLREHRPEKPERDRKPSAI